MTLLDLVAESVEGPVLVVGRMPPEGRDLDLLVRGHDMARLTTRLADAGFAERGGRWVRFGEGKVDIVDVDAVESWGLPEAEVADLFAVDGKVARPGPVHVALLEMRRWTAGGEPTDRRRARVEEALASNAQVREEVARRAAAWKVSTTPPPPRPLRRVERRLRQGSRGHVVTLSGIDGSGKSSQVEALQAALEQLGYPTATVWTRITLNPSLTVIGTPVKKVIALLSGHRGQTSPKRHVDGRPPGHGVTPADPGQAFRVRYPVVNHAWLTVIAVVNALTHWREVGQHLARGRIVVCDRYTLDSAVHLRYKYGPAEGFRLQSGIVRLLSPRPLRSYLLDVPGAVAHARKPEKYTTDDLESLAERYREEAERIGVRRLDGQQPPHQLTAAIADEVLSALVGQRRRRRRTTP